MVRYVHIWRGCVPAMGCYMAEMDDGDETITVNSPFTNILLTRDGEGVLDISKRLQSSNLQFWEELILFWFLLLTSNCKTMDSCSD